MLKKYTIYPVTGNWEKFKSRVRLSGFKSGESVLVYLAVSVWKKENGLHVSRAVNKLIARMGDYRGGRGLCPVTITSIYMSEEDLLRVSEIKQKRSRSDLFNRIVFAFIRVKDNIIEDLLTEITRNCASYSIGRVIYTRIPDWKYDILQKMATTANTSVSGLLWLVIDTFFEREEIRYSLGDLSSLLDRVMNTKGYIGCKRESGRQISMATTNDRRLRKVEGIIKNYDIPGPSELLYRIIFFLLESRNLPAPFLEDNYVSDAEPDDNELFDENEIYWNDRFSRKAYLHELYG